MKPKKFKIFHGTILYRGYNVHVSFYANSVIEAAEIIDTEPYFIRNYFSRMAKDTREFDGITAHVDSHWELRDIWHKIMPLDELKKIIDKHSNKE